MTATAVGQSRAEEGQGTVGPALCGAGVQAAEMACRVDLGMSGNFLANWATDIGGAVGGGSGNKARGGREHPQHHRRWQGWQRCPRAEDKGDCPSPHPNPCLRHRGHWLGT
jgi:hypothetical protein